MRYRIPLLLLAASALAFAPAPFPKSRKPPPPPDIVGTWTQVGNPSVTLVVTPNSLTYVNRDRPPNPYHLTFDPTKTPKTYQVRHKDDQQRIYSGIYKVEGDTLTFAYNTGTTRPAGFGGSLLESFTRVTR